MKNRQIIKTNGFPLNDIEMLFEIMKVKAKTGGTLMIICKAKDSIPFEFFKENINNKISIYLVVRDDHWQKHENLGIKILEDMKIKKVTVDENLYSGTFYDFKKDSELMADFIIDFLEVWSGKEAEKLKVNFAFIDSFSESDIKELQMLEG